MPELQMDLPSLIGGEDTRDISEQFPGWRIELIHLGRGSIRRSGLVTSIDDLRITGVHFGRAVVLRGVAPKEYSSLLSTSPPSPPLRVASRRVGGAACFMLGSQAPVDIYLPENCCAFVLSLPSPADERTGSRAANLPVAGCTEFRSLTAHHSALLSQCMDLIETFRETNSPEVIATQVQNRFRELLLPAAASLFMDSATLPQESGDKAIRRLAVSRACAYIDVHLREPIALNDLCDTAGVRARTLEYGFREFYDVGPVAYLRSVRLCRVRHDLLNSRAVGSVTRIARRWRFTHMGQFSRDYRILFGESPSATLARRRGILSQPEQMPAFGE